MGWVLEVLLPLALVEGFCLDYAFLVVGLAAVDEFDHAGVELLGLPVPPADLVVGMLDREA